MRLGTWCVTGLVALGFAAALAGEEEWKPQGEGWIQLFNGKDLTGWQFKGGTNTSWEVQDGVLANLREKDGQKRRGVDIFTEKKFRDFQLHIEFKVPKGGNSGVYLRGRKEIQVHDSFGIEKPGTGHCGGLYAKAGAKVNACKPAGEWNSFDVTIVGDTITVHHNGQLIHDKVELVGCTGGALDGDDTKPGALMMQGDHSSVWYRNIWLKPLSKVEEPKAEEKK
ncbi:MAG: DUF1080 domain-containing protein [Planctomycetes bacterium]|nr:DUF1080 domain-containing protein [Planctomycetota bacterium]